MPLSLLVALLIAFVPAGLAHAEEERDAELRESIHRVNVAVADLYENTETLPVVITVFRPPGEGRHPLLILNHGRAVQDKRGSQGRQRYLLQARWFAQQGFVVMVPTRIGYGETHSSFDPEFVPSCGGSFSLRNKDEAMVQQVLATHDFAKAQPYVNPGAWLVAGQSVGGYAAVTVARRAPEGLVGAINFAGGFGGDPDKRRNNPCGYHQWERSLSARVGTGGVVPTLWVYWKNDRYWGEDIPRKWFKAFTEGGGKGDFIQLADIEGDGHLGFTRKPTDWIPVVQRFLKTLPLTLTETPVVTFGSPRPPASGFAGVADTGKVPFIRESGRKGYASFLAKGSPRAFALNADGRWGWSAERDDAIDRALVACNNNAKAPCFLYAVDNDVVWKP